LFRECSAYIEVLQASKGWSIVLEIVADLRAGQLRILHKADATGENLALWQGYEAAFEKLLGEVSRCAAPEETDFVKNLKAELDAHEQHLEIVEEK
jgi:hypothetical protein